MGCSALPGGRGVVRNRCRLAEALLARLPALEVTWLWRHRAVACLPFVRRWSVKRFMRDRRRLVGCVPRGVPDRDRFHDLAYALAGRRPVRMGANDVPGPAAHDLPWLAAAR